MHATMNCAGDASMACGAPAPTPGTLAHAIARLELPHRARVLGKLLGFVGPLALAVLGNGAFAKYLSFARRAFVPVTIEDAASTRESDIQELVRYLSQSHPDVGIAAAIRGAGGATL